MRKFFVSRLMGRSAEDLDPFPILELPEQLVEYVLSFVSTDDLVKSCRLVCVQFQRIVDRNGFWKIKCERDGKVIPSFHLDSLPANYYRAIYVSNPYGRNLLRNGHGDEKDMFAHWQVTQNHGDGWRVEKTPAGADPLPLANQSCFATSYGVCSKEQVISLVKEGVVPEVLDIFKPAIEVSEWYAGRFDCGCMYRLIVELLDVAKKPVATFDTGELVTPQWAGRQWQQVRHTFDDYPKGVRYVRFAHLGTDTQFWAGHYGAKMAGGMVRIAAEQTNPTSTAASCETADKTSEPQHS